MRKYFLILLLLISAAGFSQAPNIIYGKDVIIQTRDTSSAELTIKNSTRNVLGYFKNIGGGKGQYLLIPQSDITALPDSLLARYTKAQADARFKSISYIPSWLELTDVPSNFSNTYALSNDVKDSIQNRVPYENATRSVALGNYRLSARGLLSDSIYARGSGGLGFYTNSGTRSFTYGAGGSNEVTFYGFAGLDYNRSGSMTGNSFTIKTQVDSLVALRKLSSDTFFTTGYTTRARLKQFGDSLGATKINLTGGVLSGTLIGTNFSALNLFVSTASNEYLRSIPATAGVAQFQTWFNSAGTRRAYFGFASGGSNITLENETASGDLIFRMNGGVLINTATTDGISKLIVNGQTSTSNLLVSGGITGQRGRVTSLVVNKDSIPITASNAWVLTVDTTGTPYTNRVNRRNINDFYVGNASFDTTARTLTLPKAGGGSTVVTIPRGTASGTSGITALSSSRTGNLVTVSGDNGSSTIFSVRDADSSAPLESLTASFGISGSPYNGTAARTWLVDTSSISTKANVTGSLVAKLNISDTLGMLSNRLRISDTLTMLSPYARTSNLPSLTPYLLKADSLSGGYTTWLLTKKKIDSLGILKVNYTDTASMLSNYRRSSTLILNSSLANSTISGVSLGGNLNNHLNGYGISGTAYNGALTQTWNVDTSAISTKANVTGSLVSKLNVSDTSSMLSNYRRSSTQIRNADLQFFQISGISLGNNLFNLNTPYGLTGTNYNGSAPVTDWKVDTSIISTKANVTGSLVAKLNTSDTAAMLSNYRKSSTQIRNSDLQFFKISGISLGDNLPNLNTPYGLTGTNYNGSALVDDWKVDTGRASIKIITGGALNKVRDSITSSTVNLTGNQTIGGNKTFTSTINGTTASFNGLGLNSSPVSAGTNQTYQQLSNTNGSFYFGKESSTAGAFFSGSSAYANVIYAVGSSNQIEFIQGGTKTVTIAAGGDATFTKSVKSAGLIQPISLKTSNYTLTTNDHTVIFDVSAASRTATLPAGVEGQIFVIKVKGLDNTKSVTVNANGSETIEGVSSYAIFSSTCGDPSYTFQFVSGNWYIISSHTSYCL